MLSEYLFLIIFLAIDAPMTAVTLL